MWSVKASVHVLGKEPKAGISDVREAILSYLPFKLTRCCEARQLLIYLPHRGAQYFVFHIHFTGTIMNLGRDEYRLIEDWLKDEGNSKDYNGELLLHKVLSKPDFRLKNHYIANV